MAREIQRAHLIIGPRQAGKSTAIWSHLAQVQNPVAFIDCEQALVQEWCRSAPLFLEDLEKLVSPGTALFFDEAQHLENAGLFIKGLVDRKVQAPLLVTGSSSFHLGAKTRESLAGRATRTRLLPLSFGEVCWDVPPQPAAVAERLRDERFVRHLSYGGYPEVWLSEAPQVLLTDLVEAVILRDASDFHRIGRPDAFRRLLRLAAGQVGNLVNRSEWAAVLGISRDTVAAYLEILASGHVVLSLSPFVGGRRAELTSTPKIYFVDNGIRNQLVGDYRALSERFDAGPTLENWVCGELWKALPDGATLHFWRSSSGAEVDFVWVDGKNLVAVEAKAARLGRPTLSRAARSFLEAYRPRLLCVLNRGLSHAERVGESEVRWIEPGEFVGLAQRRFSSG